MPRKPKVHSSKIGLAKVNRGGPLNTLGLNLPEHEPVRNGEYGMPRVSPGKREVAAQDVYRTEAEMNAHLDALRDQHAAAYARLKADAERPQCWACGRFAPGYTWTSAHGWHTREEGGTRFCHRVVICPTCYDEWGWGDELVSADLTGARQPARKRKKQLVATRKGRRHKPVAPDPGRGRKARGNAAVDVQRTPDT